MCLSSLFEPLTLKRGPALKNRILLAPLTNWQSNDDGTATHDEFNWLNKCALGGFSMVMTCAANVHPYGKAFQGQLGIYDDKQLIGLRKIAALIRENGAVSSVQIHHAGIRADPGLGSTRLGPSDIPAIGARGLSLEEVEQIREDFIVASNRAESAGFDGVEIHAAFGWLPMQFLSPTYNHRNDKYGGPLQNRSRFLFEIIDGIRSTCGPEFQIGFRISMERYGVSLSDTRAVVERLLEEERVDYVDLALWDYKKMAHEAPFIGQTLLSVFTTLPRSSVRLGASGKIRTARDAKTVLSSGCDFVMLGKAAILRSDFPQILEKDPEYQLPSLPVSQEYLRRQGLSDRFIDGMKSFSGFVAD